MCFGKLCFRKAKCYRPLTIKHDTFKVIKKSRVDFEGFVENNKTYVIIVVGSVVTKSPVARLRRTLLEIILNLPPLHFDTQGKP